MQRIHRYLNGYVYTSVSENELNFAPHFSIYFFQALEEQIAPYQI